MDGHCTPKLPDYFIIISSRAIAPGQWEPRSPKGEEAQEQPYPVPLNPPGSDHPSGPRIPPNLAGRQKEQAQVVVPSRQLPCQPFVGN